jgi:hypothetical protein
MLTRGKHVSMCGWRYTIWAVFAAPPGDQISHPIMLLDATPIPFHQVMYVSLSVWRFIISWHFFLFSLFPKNLGLPPFFFPVSISILILFISIFSFLLIEVLVIFNLVLQFQFDIFYLFQLGPYCFDLWFFFLWPFCEFFFQFIHQL